MNCTTLHLEKRVAYRSLCFLLLVGLFVQACTPEQDHPIWDADLVIWVSKRRSRVCYRSAIASRLHMVKRRGVVMLCRMGFMSVLLVWSGWAQYWPKSWFLLSLPLTDALLSSLPLYWSQVLKVRAYRYAVRGIHRLYGLTLGILLLTGLSAQRKGNAAWAIGGCVQVADGAWANGEIEEDGTWHLEMEGHIIIRWKPRDEFERRVLLILFRQIRTPQSTPQRPFLRQEWLAEWFETYQEWISRWQRYVRQGGLEKLRGEHEAWVLTPEMRQAILEVWAPNFWLTAKQVRERLLAAGHIASVQDICVASIHQVAQESGFTEVRRLLCQVLVFSANGPQWRDNVLVSRLFELNEALISRLQAREGLTPQLQLEAEALKEAVGAPVTPLKKTLPFAYRLQQVLFGQWEEIDDHAVRCPHCGSGLVARKENTPRSKKYRDPETREWLQVDGYRHYCLNPSCSWGTFTDYPQQVRLYAEWTVDTVLWGVMVYMHLRTTYRRAADVVGVSSVTLWRWTMAVGEQTLPLAQLFGLVRSSGVIGVDEKWVLVPKNDKPEGKRKRWMYVRLWRGRGRVHL
jgi:hypothetical protein